MSSLTASFNNLLIRVLRGKYKRTRAMLIAGALLSVCSATQAQATNYYVSPNGNNTTGLSPATAWTSFSQIKWNLVSGNTLYIDGGTTGLTYNQSLVVPAGLGWMQIQGYGQRVILDGQKSLATGITINSPCNISGADSTQLLVQNFTNAGVVLNPAADSSRTVVRNMEITNNTKGIYLPQAPLVQVILRF